jgi:glycosyltransferase involved in cell wall biosynthesis
MIILSYLALAFAALPFALTLCNLLLLRTPRLPTTVRHRISVLIPARNEAANIAPALAAVLANAHPDYEVLVLDDGSTDETAALVRAHADPRLRLLEGSTLPTGWTGKVHACQRLSEAATGDILLFIDADVRLDGQALLRLDGFFQANESCALVSGVPRQITVTAMEKLIVPLINFVLLGFLPLLGMRHSPRAGFAAACGQFIAVRAHEYRAMGGHGAVRGHLHDGIYLARAFRQAGYGTDLIDVSRLASCRMYHNAAEVWHGFAKNATEAMATPVGLPVWTVLLAGGQILPFFLVFFDRGVLVWLACALPLLTRLLLARRFRDSWWFILHPLGVALFLAIQYSAFFAARRGVEAEWRGRLYNRA